MEGEIRGIAGMTPGEIDFEVQRGGRFVYFEYCISAVVVTFKKPSAVYFIPKGEGTFLKSLPYTLVSLLLGWWGFPWGPIYTVQTVFNNLSGGEPAVLSYGSEE